MKVLLLELYLRGLYTLNRCEYCIDGVDVSKSFKLTNRCDAIFGTYYLFNSNVYNYNHREDRWYIWII